MEEYASCWTWVGPGGEHREIADFLKGGTETEISLSMGFVVKERTTATTVRTVTPMNYILGMRTRFGHYGVIAIEACHFMKNDCAWWQKMEREHFLCSGHFLGSGHSLGSVRDKKLAISVFRDVDIEPEDSFREDHPLFWCKW